MEYALDRNFPTLKPSTPPLLHYEDLTVNYFLNPVGKSWNIPLVQSLFNHQTLHQLSLCLYSLGCILISASGSYHGWLLHCQISIPHMSRPYSRCHSCSTWFPLEFYLEIADPTASSCLLTRSNLLARGIPCDDTCVSCEQLAE